jgi:hypothetical protein
MVPVATVPTSGGGLDARAFDSRLLAQIPVFPFGSLDRKGAELSADEFGDLAA